jgi:hypothetical protein
MRRILFATAGALVLGFAGSAEAGHLWVAAHRPLPRVAVATPTVAVVGYSYPMLAAPVVVGPAPVLYHPTVIAPVKAVPVAPAHRAVRRAVILRH